MTKHPLAEYRESRGLKQVEIAKAVGVSRWTITMIETRQRVPSVGLISRLVRFSGGVLRADDFVAAEKAA